MVRKSINKKACLNVVFEALRNGSSLFASCEKAGITTKEFYDFLAGNVEVLADYHLALADYADKCTDNIKAIAKNLQSGEIDNSTAKLLIETEKWLAQKACPQPYAGKIEEVGEGEGAEIIVKFI